MSDRIERLRKRLEHLLPFIAGYALIDAWSQTVFSASFFAQTTFSDQVLKYLVAIVPALALLLISRHVESLARRRYREILYLFGMTASAGTGFLLFIMYGLLDGYWTKAVLVFLAAARVCLLICWWERLSSYSIKDMWLAIGGAIVLGAIFSLIPSLFPGLVGNCFAVVAPLLSTVLLPMRKGREGALSDSNDSDLCEKATSLRAMFQAIPWMLVLILGLINIPSEALVFLEMVNEPVTASSPGPLASALTRAFVNLSALLLAFFAVRTNGNLAVFIAVPVVVLASFLLTLGVEVPYSLLHTICRIGSEIVRYVIVYALLESILRRRVSPLFCFSFMTLVHAIGSACGAICALSLGDNPSLLSMLFMGTLLASALLVIGAMQQGSTFGTAKHGLLEKELAADDEGGEETDSASAEELDESNDPLFPQFGENESAFARHYNLTQREIQVLHFWVRGRTASYIEEQLCISKHTVKTHIGHIYEKTGVSSKEDLISLMEVYLSAK